jgi:hypothetical protein
VNTRGESSLVSRIVSGILAIVWLSAGCTAVVLSVGAAPWPLGVAGVLALWYGLLWVRVMRFGKRLTVREALMPWRVEER